MNIECMRFHTTLVSLDNLVAPVLITLYLHNLSKGKCNFKLECHFIHSISWVSTGSSKQYPMLIWCLSIEHFENGAKLILLENGVGNPFFRIHQIFRDANINKMYLDKKITTLFSFLDKQTKKLRFIVCLCIFFLSIMMLMLIPDMKNFWCFDNRTFGT